MRIKTTDNTGATTADAISASTADFSTGETNGTWIGVIKAVKSALAKAASKYDKGGHVSITIDGIPYTVRTDCSGLFLHVVEHLVYLMEKYHLHNLHL